MKKILTLALAICTLTFAGCTKDDPKDEPSKKVASELTVAADNLEGLAVAEVTKAITVTANCDWTVEIEYGSKDIAAWIQKDKSSGNGNGTVNIKIFENTAPAARDAVIKFASADATVKAEVKVSQVAAEKPLEPLELTFDFTTCPAGWPNAVNNYNDAPDDKTNPKEYVYTLGEVNYKFTLLACDGASASKICWGYDGKTNEAPYFFIMVARYMGLPAIENYKLTGVKFTQAMAASEKRKAGVCATVVGEKDTIDYLAGGEDIVVGEIDTEYSFTLTNAEAAKRYYLYCSGKSFGFSSLTLNYEPVKK